MKLKSFTLIELLIVIAIIGIVETISIPNLLTALQKGKQKTTIGDIKIIDNAIESFMTDMQMAPRNGFINTMSALNIYYHPDYCPLKTDGRRNPGINPLREDLGAAVYDGMASPEEVLKKRKNSNGNPFRENIKNGGK